MLLTGVLVFLAVFLFAFGLSRSFTATRRRIVQRIETLDPKAKARAKADKKAERKRRDRPDRPRRAGPRIKLRVNFMNNLEAALLKGEFQVSPRDLVLRWLLATLILAVAVFLFKGIIPAVLLILVSAMGTLVYIRSRGSRRLQRFEEGLHDTLTIVANSLRSGYSFLQALQVVTEDMHGPIQEEFTRVLDEMNVGVPLETALKSMSVRVQSEDFDLIVTAILIQRQVGGNLAEVLDQIAVTIRERVRLKAEVKVLTSQGRMSAIIFLLLPIGIAAFLLMIEPSYFKSMTQSLIGIVMLVMAAIMQGFGYFLIRRIVDIKL